MLFSHLPSGATYLRDIISPDDEEALISELDRLPWSTELKRRVQHFGYRYDYRARTVTDDAYLGPLPYWLDPFCRRLVSEGHFVQTPSQVIANDYLPGQGISAHVDCVPCFGDHIASLSLLSPCEMIFRHTVNAEKRALVVEPRSLLLLSGPARYDWTHEIPPRLSDVIGGVKYLRKRRISLTFRNVVAS
jgi:alkylated DNA repair dioxygenase AlkB